MKIVSDLRWGNTWQLCRRCLHAVAQREQLSLCRYPDSSSHLKQCIRARDFVQGRLLHDNLIREGLGCDIVTMNLLVDLYGKCGLTNDALQQFSYIHCKNVFSWTIVITACMQSHQSNLGYQLFLQMQLEGVLADKFTYSVVIGLFTSEEFTSQGKFLHACILQRGFDDNSIIFTSLVNMYGKSGCPYLARNAFDAMHFRDSVSWNTMIAAYAHHGHPKEALEIYHQMRQNKVPPTETTFTSILRACSCPGALSDGKSIHSHIIDSGLGTDMVKTALVSMYGNCGSLEESIKVYNEIHCQDVVSMNAMLDAYIQNEDGKDALRMFCRMLKMKLEPTTTTYLSVISACSLIGAALEGKLAHMIVAESGLDEVELVATAFVNMYGKCGNLSDAWRVFSKMTKPDCVAWNVMIAVCAQNGDDKMSLQLFEEMKQDGIKPDSVTYLSALCACTHAGLLADAIEYFDTMQNECGIEPNPKHYACMIDLFGRAGLLEEAEKFMKKLPCEPDEVVLTAYAGACRLHAHNIRAKWAAKRLIDLDPHGDYAYILLSNIYAAEGRWKDVIHIRRKMEQNVKTKVGKTWIEVDGKQHEFISGDKSHPCIKAIYSELNALSEELKRARYVTETKLVLQIQDEICEACGLCDHSETLAIVFGLLKIPVDQSIRVFNNVSMCPDCHVGIKAISKIRGREIVVRDANQFHQFVAGSCSCGGYW